MNISIRKTRDIVTPDLARKLKAARNPTKALEAMGTQAVSMATRAFTDPALRPTVWAPLKPATLKAKARKKYGSKPLINTGMLEASPRITHVDKRNVTVGSDRKQAGVQQLGSKDGTLPPRPFFPFDKEGRPTEKAKRLILSAATRALNKEVLP